MNREPPIIPDPNFSTEQKSNLKFSKKQLAGLLILLIALPLIVFVAQKNQEYRSQAKQINNEPIRGLPGDLWADTVIGKRDFTEISPREIVPYKINSPGGVAIDRSVSPGRMYVWDSGNNRILGVDLGTCYGTNGPCNANIVIGQPSGNDYGGCNQDSSFQNYPNRKNASASTLCGTWEGTHTTLEDKSFVSMYVDNQGNLYVPDARNHRVLKYNSPFTTDTIADDFWGQNDFTGNECNITGNTETGYYPPPTNMSLCFFGYGLGSGVTLDQAGNMWVADGGNNRVLRFSKNPQTGVINKTADLVLGQDNFQTSHHGSTSERLYGPMALRFAPNGDLYVVDNGNLRIMKYRAPFTTGMAGTSMLTGAFTYPSGIEIDPQGRGFWVFDTTSNIIKLWRYDGTYTSIMADTLNNGGGSFGFDTLNNLLESTYVYGQNVNRHDPSGNYELARGLFSPPIGYNLTSSRRLEHPAWVGLAVTNSQLVVVDKRLLFWNNPANLVNGIPPDGHVGTANPNEIPDPEFFTVEADQNNHIFAIKGDDIHIYNAPLTTNAQPIKIISNSLPVLGTSDRVGIQSSRSLAATSNGNFLYVSRPQFHQVFRIRNPLATQPQVDMILGQDSVDNIYCNRDPNDPRNQDPWATGPDNDELNTLCYPGAIALDRQENLYISDHFIEVAGNKRLLLFQNLPQNNQQAIFGPNATKEFPRIAYNQATFEPAFNNQNQMVIGYNPYSQKRFLDYYLNPTLRNPSNPSDPAYAIPDGRLKDFYGWPVAMQFDNSNNLYAYDANRGQVRIYKTPILVPNQNRLTPTPGPTPIPNPTLTPGPTPIPIYKKYFRHGVVESIGTKSWYRDCELTTQNEPNYRLCTTWKGPIDLTNLRGVGDESYTSFENKSYINSFGKWDLIKTMIPANNTTNKYEQKCIFKPSGDIDCSPGGWTNRPFPQNYPVAEGGYSNYFYTKNGAQTFRESYINSIGDKSWYRECEMGPSGPDFSRCSETMAGPFDLSNLRGIGQERYFDMTAFTYERNTGSGPEQIVQQQLTSRNDAANNLTKAYYRECKIETNGSLTCPNSFNELHLGNLSQQVSSPISGISGYIYTHTQFPIP